MNLITSLSYLISLSKPLIDILILSIVFYNIYKVLLITRALQFLRASIFLALFYLLANVLQLQTILWLYSKLGFVVFIGLAIAFQPELRKIFSLSNRSGWFSSDNKNTNIRIDQVISAAEELSMMKRGALIVFTQSFSLKNIAEAGTMLDAILSSALIKTIFAHDNPLHDGAILITDDRIVSAGCLLPLSKQDDIMKTFGTRHRAALGLSEESDAVILVVSEENSYISIAHEGILHYDLTAQEALQKLYTFLKIRDIGKEIEK